eukprot:349848-Pleurochrysis_carterae.AAC.3
MTELGPVAGVDVRRTEAGTCSGQYRTNASDSLDSCAWQKGVAPTSRSLPCCPHSYPELCLSLHHPTCTPIYLPIYLAAWFATNTPRLPPTTPTLPRTHLRVRTLPRAFAGSIGPLLSLSPRGPAPSHLRPRGPRPAFKLDAHALHPAARRAFDVAAGAAAARALIALTRLAAARKAQEHSGAPTLWHAEITRYGVWRGGVILGSQLCEGFGCVSPVRLRGRAYEVCVHQRRSSCPSATVASATALVSRCGANGLE